MRRALCIWMVISCSLFAAEQGPVKLFEDSLRRMNSTGASDTAKVNLIYKLAWEYRHNNIEKADSLIRIGFRLAEENKYKKGMAACLNVRGEVLFAQGKYDSALIIDNMALRYFSELGLQTNVAGVYNNIAGIYYFKGNYSRCLEFLLKSVKIQEKMNNYQGLGEAYSNLGVISLELYSSTHNKQDVKNAESYMLKSLEAYRKAKKDERNIASVLQGLAAIYNTTGEYDRAKVSLFQAREIQVSFKNDRGLGELYIELGNVYAQEYQDKRRPVFLDSARFWFNEGLVISKKLNTRQQQPAIYFSLGEIEMILNKYSTAIEKYLLAFEIATELDYKDQISTAAKALSTAYELSGDASNALKYYKVYTEVKDTILNNNNNKLIKEMQTQYETEKKEKENSILKNEAALKDAQIGEERNFRYFLFGVVGLAAVLIIVALVAYRNKQQDNKLLSHQKDLIEGQKKEITDSINYARRIQSAILPEQNLLGKYFAEYFIFYRPKDIVSGDFYWWNETTEGLYLACADCTGHGVPGALMSMVGKEKLDTAVVGSRSTDAVLSELNRLVRSTLRQGAGEDASRDGMDIALVKIEKGSLHYSGANRPLWIWRNAGMLEFKPTKAAIGGLTNDDQEFSLEHIGMNPGDMIYLFTDGFADQFGGASSKKFTTRHFRELLLRIGSFPAKQQEQELQQAFTQWQGSLDQVDDVLVIGLRV